MHNDFLSWQTMALNSTRPKVSSLPSTISAIQNVKILDKRTFKAGSHMPAACLRLYHYAPTCRRNTGKVELNSTFPAYCRCNCGTGGKRRTSIHIIYVLNYHRHRRGYVAGIYVNPALISIFLSSSCKASSMMQQMKRIKHIFNNEI